jgi:hypothetical protein
LLALFAFRTVSDLHPTEILGGSFLVVVDCCGQGCLVVGVNRVAFASLPAFETFGVEVPCGACVLVSSLVVARSRY